MMETLDSCFKGFPPCELDAAIGEGHCLLLLDIYPRVSACTPSTCARLYDGLTASHKFPYSGPSTCRPAQRWKIRGRLYCSAGFGDVRRSLLWRNRTVIDDGADGIAAGLPRPPGAVESGGPLIYGLLLCMWQHYICNTQTLLPRSQKQQTQQGNYNYSAGPNAPGCSYTVRQPDR